MKLSKIIFTIFILLAAAQFCLAQEKISAILADRFGEISCDDFLGRFDNFFTEVQKYPASTGYMMIFVEKDNLKDALRHEFWIDDHLTFRKIPKERINTIRMKTEGPLKIEFWILPVGATMPKFDGERWTNILSSDFKAFAFGTNMGEMCSGFNSELYGDFLQKNEAAEGLLIVSENTRRAAKERGEAEIEKLSKGLNIPRARFRMSYKKRNPDLYGIEYWIAPVKKK